MYKYWKVKPWNPMKSPFLDGWTPAVNSPTHPNTSHQAKLAVFRNPASTASENMPRCMFARAWWLGCSMGWFSRVIHGSLNVPIEHHPTIRYMVYNGYYKVMSNIPKMGQLPTPVISWSLSCIFLSHFSVTWPLISLHEMGKIQRFSQRVCLTVIFSEPWNVDIMLINGLGLMPASLLLRWHTQVHNLILWDSMVIFINVLKTSSIFRATSVRCSGLNRLLVGVTQSMTVDTN